MLHEELLKTQKNLLAFSGGTDSSALFYLLLEKNIPFDLIFVNYNTRKESKEEENRAIELAGKYQKKIYIKQVNISNKANFEKKARDIRHIFFKKIAELENYQNVVTGHNLNDKVEWFLMQFTKGAGSEELFGMRSLTNMGFYNIVRPLLSTEKESIMEYLEENSIKYSYDISNSDQKYRRNYFRHNFASKLTREFGKGIQRTFDILEKELSFNEVEVLYQDKDCIFAKKTNNIVKSADQILKRFDYVMSYSQRNEFEEKETLVFEKKKNLFVISIYKDILLLTPFIKSKMSKKEKDFFRINSIPVNNRSYLNKHKKLLKEFLND